MYTAYFQLREPPFSIAPDPSYLYMSARHQEALGHLLYGTGQYGGFVQLTGEVGTGKTTIVRTLLAQRLPDVDVAMIHNPRQSELEFVASICDELRVPYPPGATLKTLVDELNARLLDTHSRGRRTVVIIDEAQNLDPGVLEQVRLLTNLETDKEKLLRILLVGQPELFELLARPDLRQLASRITARYHLLPLTAHETREYIMHRLRVAGGSPDLFTPAAIERVHQLTQGNPRQTNILCDRALLGAYSQNRRQVTPDLVDLAAREALGVDTGLPASVGRRLFGNLKGGPLLWIEALVACLAALMMVLLLHKVLTRSAPAPIAVTASTPAPQAAAAAPATPATPASIPDANTASAEIAQNPSGSEQLALLQRSSEPLVAVLGRLIRTWDNQLVIPAGQNICSALAHDKLGCYRATGTWADLEQINHPAILTLNLGDGQPTYVLLRALGTGYALIDGPEGTHRFPLDGLDALWTGEFLLLWHQSIDAQFIGPQTKGTSVVWLRRQLSLATGRRLPNMTSPRYDNVLSERVRQFQISHGLAADGVAGIRTLIALSELDRGPQTPVLNAPPTEGNLP